MQDTQYKEVLIVLVACITLFLILAAIILLFLYLYQRRRFIQERQMAEMQLQYKEQLFKVQLEIQEETFQSISREIHDNVGQVLSLVKVQINIMNESEAMDRSILQDARENIGNVLADLRDLAGSLSSERIRSYSLEETVGKEATRINKTGILRADVVTEGNTREIDPQKKLFLFRIVQESIQNCIKHAEATNILILLRYQEESIYVSVKDNGKGFNTNARPSGGSGMGLDNIRTRVGLMGGKFTLESVSKEGTTLIITIPYE